MADDTTTDPATDQTPVEPDASRVETGDSQRTYTKDQLEEIVERRLVRERAKYADYDDLKSAAGKLAEIEDAQRSDLERAQQAAREADERAAAAEQRFRSALITSAIATEAAKSGADPTVVSRLVDSSDLVVSDDGTVEGVDKAVADLLASHPYLKRPTPGSFDGGARGGDGGPPTFTRSQLRDPSFYAENQQEILQAAREGRIVNDLQE